jgi:hypothetical protein
MTASFALLFVVFSLQSCSPDSSEGRAVAVGEGARESLVASPASLHPVLYELMMSELMRSPAKWPDLDSDLKNRAIEGFIGLIRLRENATIGRPADYYVSRIDEMLEQNPNTPQGIPALLKILAVMDYDYDSGQDKDQLAREVLGPQLYAANRARLAQNAGAMPSE